MGRSAVLLFFAMLASATASAEDPVRYTLRFPAPDTHYVEVEAQVSTGGRAEIELMMPVWTPGSYLVRDYSGRVEQVSASDSNDNPLNVQKTRKNRWLVETGGDYELSFRYQVYCREMSVRSNWVERDFAIINGAPTIMALLDDTGKPARVEYEIRLEMPESWPRAHSGLPSENGVFRAKDYDTVVDSPIMAGDLAVYEFAVEGKPHYLVNLGEGGVWDGDRSAVDVGKIVEEQVKFWGVVPYESYSFLNAITEGRGGLEHLNSTMLMTSRWATRTRKAYLGWLNLASHEFFHAWNVKRLRPDAITNFDYETENYVGGLWVSEGLTSYYDPLFVRRAGLSSHKEYLSELSGEIEKLQGAAGRLVQSVEESSYDAWVKYYRRNENTANTVVSYYTKGALIGFILDAKIRRTSKAERSLDDLMKAAYERFSGDTGFTRESFGDLVEELSSPPIAAWLHETVRTADELDFDEALDWYGLRFKPSEEEDEPVAFLGIGHEAQAGRMIVTEVKRGTPAFDAGLNVNDELIGIDDYRISAEGLNERLKQYRPEDALDILIARRERLLTLKLTAAETPPSWELEVDPEASDDQKRRLIDWLGRDQE